ncbi:MAG: hypothetical protein ACJ79L_03715 [Anaeromyxobacteraceae bacterium]
MNRWLLAALALASAAACGGGSNGGTAGGAPSGTLFGTAFTAADSASAVAGPTSCTFPQFGGVSASVAALVIGFGDQAGLCASVQQPCALKPNGRTVTLVVARAGLQAQGPIGPATYPITTGTPTPDASGVVTFATAAATRLDASCGEAPGAPAPTGGTVTVTSVSGTSVRGTVDVTFSDGGRIGGAFDAPVCQVAFDVCAQQVPACSTTPTCHP